MCPAYEAMVAVADEMKWSPRFPGDLRIHDKQAVSHHPKDKPFMWAIDPDGTHFFKYWDPDEPTRWKGFAKSVLAMWRGEMFPEITLYHWEPDAKKLCKVRDEEQLKRLNKALNLP